MRTDMQRRDPRVPLGVLVELTHDDFDEPFEADAVDVGPGGLGMRAAFLPDVGSRLTCKFDSPADGSRVEAPCEVVWAQDNGPHIGHVGLRFTALDGPARDAIEQMMSTTASAPPVEEPAPPAEAEAAPTRKSLVEPCVDEAVDDDHAHVHLMLDGVDAAVPARVVARHAEGVRVVQKLALFRLGTGVAVVNGERRRGRIEAVSIRAQGDVPELVLDVAYDEGGAAADVAEPMAPAVSEPPVRPEAEVIADGEPDTIPDSPAPSVPGAAAEAAAMEAPLDAEPPFEAPRADEPTPAPAVRVIRSPKAERAEATLSGVGSPTVEPAASGRAGLRRAASAVRSVAREARPALARLWAGLASLLVRAQPFFAAARARVRIVATRVAPAARRLVTRSASFGRHFLAALGSRVGAKLPFGGTAGRRRKTAPPPARSNVAGTQKGRAAADPRKERARTLVLSLAAFAGAAALVYALSPTSTDEVDVHRDVPALDAADAPAESASPEPSAAGGAGDEAASPAPDHQGSDAKEAAEPQAPGTVPSDSPYAAKSGEGKADAPASSEEPAPELTQAFGAESVPDGRSFLLRMSQPVEALRGIPEQGGFTVIIPDSLSLDRAGPIAAAHPAVERSMILNRGDHAELNIRFAQGKSPAYRVVARGRAIEIEIGR